ncbi:hypothetical protein RHGRI_012045 [Rhododendron griersonianum]|uniref:Uncharacterized protein n=1 Tax=Rhododendron griersonianum TaxID=479676 RepID=A0AAV6KP16_9ERIC|nr:hypothetical protein RHGRI_012045 [Rhododendron griersonianum]
MKTVACFLVLCLWLAALTNFCFADDEQLSDLTVDSAWFDSQSNREEPLAAPSLDKEKEAKHKPHKAPAPTSPKAPTPSSPGHKHKHKHHKHRKTPTSPPKPAPTPSPAMTPPQHP